MALVTAMTVALNFGVTAETDRISWLATIPPVPEFRIPADPAGWRLKRDETRAALWKLLGRLPARPAKPEVTVTAREEKDGYTLERFQFDNGAGAIVPGVLLLPKKAAAGKVPAILYNHWHGGEYHKGKAELFETNHTPVVPGPVLAGLGYAVLAIDAPCFGERNGRGPDGEKGGAGELSASKFELWAGRTFWGMLLRDDLMALDYLASRPEVDTSRIGATGISMGATRTWWLMALDERIKAGVAVACLTRYQNLISAGGLKYHGIYYYVPGMLEQFDTEAVVACAAPRPLLCLNGDRDEGSPVDGIHEIERRVKPAWAVAGTPDAFRSDVFPGVGHSYTPEMWARMLEWFREKL